MKNRKSPDSLRTTLLALPIAISLAVAPVVSAQTYPPPPPAGAPARAEFSQEDLDRMLAPIALYPDALLSQILMASTYPLEVVQAARWSRANPGLRGDRAVRAVERKDWDPSVKSLVAFPQILAMMDAKLEWTERLGDAFLAQEPQVMDSVQHLRQRAYAAGTLRSDDRIRVEPQGSVIVIVPADPEIVYVPYYDPTVVYGTWWWPEPPVYWGPWGGYRPPYQGFFLSWGIGIPVVSGFFFGAFDWPHHHARVVNVNTYYYNRTVVVNRRTDVRTRTVVRNVNAAPGVWQHDPAHRRGAPYRDAGVRQRFATESAQTAPRAAPAVRPQTRTMDNGRNTHRAAPPATQPRVEQRNAEQRNARPVPRPAPQPRAESAERHAPAPQPRKEVPRVRPPQPSAAPHPAPNGREGRPAGSRQRQENGDKQRGGGRERRD
ncbi:MAG TPA: DUF3300 domain-containing protein [Burkholderiales bacterium]|nr:DUF3300 domain-containing protein [Burkholderiales bacterium]